LRALAAVELTLGRPAEALRALDRCLAPEPEPVRLLLLRSIALGRLGRRAEALDARDRARAEAGPGTPIGLLGRLLETSERAIGP
jgi:tetratricopeptide (TPR) repeat protein